MRSSGDIGYPVSVTRNDKEATIMTKRSDQSIERAKKKRRRAIPRAKVTSSLGNTGAGRTRAKKAAGLRRGRATAKG